MHTFNYIYRDLVLKFVNLYLSYSDNEFLGDIIKALKGLCKKLICTYFCSIYYLLLLVFKKV